MWPLSPCPLSRNLPLVLDSSPLLSSHLTSLLVYSHTETAVGGRLCSKLFPYVHSILTRQVLTIPILQMRKLRQKEVKQLPPNYKLIDA